jgi:hypothetical protein
MELNLGNVKSFMKDMKGYNITGRKKNEEQ